MSRTVPDIAGIKAYDISGIYELIDELGFPKFRAKQLIEWIYGKNVNSYEDMTNLPKSMREKMSEEYPLNPSKIVDSVESYDGTKKYIIEYSDGTLVEAVGIPTKTRLTVCFSTQAGCPMACAFCATGKGGYKRNLAPGEIYDQVALISRDFGRRATNAVAMGQGEPFLNYDSVIGAARLLNSEAGANIGARHITISTCGIIPMIRRFANEPEQFTLAISLHSANQYTRNKLMPHCREYELDRLRASIKSYSDTTGRRPTFEYAMMRGMNDTEEEKEALIEFCSKMLCHVNLIALNPIENARFKPSDPERIEDFKNSLESKGIETSVRNSRGSDIQSACGQLVQNYCE